MATNFRGQIGVAHPPSFFVLAFDKKFEYRYADERINSGDDSSTWRRKLVSFGPSETTRLECVQQASSNMGLVNDVH